MANTISGTVKLNGVPTSARVTIVNIATNAIAGSVTSSPSTGLWSVTGLAAGRYEAVVCKSGYRAEVQGPFELDGTGGTGGFADEVAADSPVWFCRHSEGSGTTAVNEVGVDGTYGGTPVFGAPAIYTGGLPCWDTNGASWCDIPASILPSPNSAMTLELLIKRKSDITGFQAMIDRDPESGGRWWQWRWEGGDDLQFIKIIGSIQTLQSDNIGPADGVGLFAITIAAGGAFKAYKNGVEVGSATFSPADYGTSSVGLRIARRLQGDSQANYYCAETMVYTTELSAARLLAHAAAAGL